MMKILLIYPEFPDTFRSFTHALSFIGKKAAFPALGLITVAALLLSVASPAGKVHGVLEPGSNMTKG
jgi:hypothetical protein